jgi:hypothetical protein
MVNVDVRLARVAGVSAATEELAFHDRIALGDAQAPFLQVRDDDEGL